MSDLAQRAREQWKATDLDGTYICKLSLADCRSIDEKVIQFATNFVRAELEAVKQMLHERAQSMLEMKAVIDGHELHKIAEQIGERQR